MRYILQNKSFYFLVLTLIFLSGSCTVQKRVHRKGWFVQWNFSQQKSADQENASKESSIISEHDLSCLPSDTATSHNLQNENTSFSTPQQVQYKAYSKSVLGVEFNSLEQTKYIEQVNTDESENTLEYHPSSYSRFRMKSLSPTRVPALAWTLLFLGILLVTLAIIFGLIYLVINGSLIGAPLYLGIMLLGGIISLALATRTALASMNTQPSPPDPRVEREEPKEEKKERQPLKKGDKIFIAVAVGLLVLLGIVVITY